MILRRWARFLVCLALVGSLAGPAGAVSITLSDPTPGPGSGTITFTVGLDTPTAVNGYDVTIFWDAAELSILSWTELSGLGFDAPPTGTTPAGERVAALELTAVTATDLFSVSFGVLPGALGDGAADFGVFVGPANGSGLIPGAIDNPLGDGFDVVPEPASAVLLAMGLVVLGGRRIRQREDR